MAVGSFCRRFGGGRRGGSPRGRAAVDRHARGLSAQRRALAEYEHVVQPLLHHGGQIVVDGLRPAVADIDNQTFPDEVLAGMADGWLADMQSVRSAVAGVRAPAFVARAQALYNDALAGYVTTAARSALPSQLRATRGGAGCNALHHRVGRPTAFVTRPSRPSTMSTFDSQLPPTGGSQ